MSYYVYSILFNFLALFAKFRILTYTELLGRYIRRKDCSMSTDIASHGSFKLRKLYTTGALYGSYIRRELCTAAIYRGSFMRRELYTAGAV